MACQRTILGVCLALAAWGAACAPAAVQTAVATPPVAERPSLPPPPFSEGEWANYAVSVLGIPAATARVEAGRSKGRWRFEAEGAGLGWLQTFYPLELRMTSTARARDLHPVELVRAGNNGGKVLTRRSRWHKKGRVRLSVSRPGKKTRRGWRRTVPEALDPLGLLFRMRWAAAAGELEGSVWHSFDGVWTRRVTLRELPAEGEQEVEVPAGRFPARRFEMRMVRVKVKGDRRRPRDPEDRTWNVWVSDDERYLPLVAEGMTPFGPAKVALVGWGEAPRVAAPRVAAR